MVGARMVRTVEELRALGGGSEIRFEPPPGKEPILARRSGDWFLVTGSKGWYTEEQLEHLLPATVLAPAVDPDDKALVEKVARALHDGRCGCGARPWADDFEAARLALKAVTQ